MSTTITVDQVIAFIATGDSLDTTTVIAAACLLAAHGRGMDAGEFAAHLGAHATAVLGGVDELMANRPGSWEADGFGTLVRNTIGYDPTPEHLDSWKVPELARWTPAREFTTGDDIPADVLAVRPLWDEAGKYGTWRRDSEGLWSNDWSNFTRVGDLEKNAGAEEYDETIARLTDAEMYEEHAELIEVREPVVAVAP
jgi:hypothetical protein